MLLILYTGYIFCIKDKKTKANFTRAGITKWPRRSLYYNTALQSAGYKYITITANINTQKILIDKAWKVMPAKVGFFLNILLI